LHYFLLSPPKNWLYYKYQITKTEVNYEIH